MSAYSQKAQCKCDPLVFRASVTANGCTRSRISGHIIGVCVVDNDGRISTAKLFDLFSTFWADNAVNVNELSTMFTIFLICGVWRRRLFRLMGEILHIWIIVHGLTPQKFYYHIIYNKLLFVCQYIDYFYIVLYVFIMLSATARFGSHRSIA